MNCLEVLPTAEQSLSLWFGGPAVNYWHNLWRVLSTRFLFNGFGACREERVNCGGGVQLESIRDASEWDEPTGCTATRTKLSNYSGQGVVSCAVQIKLINPCPSLWFRVWLACVVGGALRSLPWTWLHSGRMTGERDKVYRWINVWTRTL